ncbi:protein FAM228A isoform 2-T2 [Menidia menidia]
MGDVRKNSPRAEISSHLPSSACLLKSEKHTADFKDVIKSRKSVSQPRGRMWSAHPCVRPGKRNKASSPCWQKQDLEHSRLFHTSLRQLQAKLEAESQQAQEMIHHLQDTENGLMKLELFLRQREEVGLRRRELLHKHWTERVWFPLQKTVEEHACSRSPAEAKRLRNYYSHYLHHCDSKGYIFLETYDPREYNPFLLKKPPYLKLKKVNSTDTSYHRRTSLSCETGCKYTCKKALELSQDYQLFIKSVLSQSSQPPQASSQQTVSAPITISVKDKSDQKKSGRYINILF